MLRNGIRDMGCKFQLAYFRPASGLNEETRQLYIEATFSRLSGSFTTVRKTRRALTSCSSSTASLSLLSNSRTSLTGQTVGDAIRQYKRDRDPRELLFNYGRCLAHFAVDPELVYVTTRLAGPQTRFLPFNRGKYGGAGNPPASPTGNGYATSYLWEETWARDSVLDLMRQFVHEVQEEDEKGRKTGNRFLIFPRYQQLDCVRQLVADAQGQGTGRRYLIQHSAGSGKTFTISWLAHQLSTLHNSEDRRIFDSIVVITDRLRA